MGMGTRYRNKIWEQGGERGMGTSRGPANPHSLIAGLLLLDCVVRSLRVAHEHLTHGALIATSVYKVGVAMAAIAVDESGKRQWGRVVSFNLSAGAEKAKKAASTSVQYSQQLLWNTGKAAWIAGTSFLVLVVPLIIRMDRDSQQTPVDLEGGQATSSSSSPSTSIVK